MRVTQYLGTALAAVALSLAAPAAATTLTFNIQVNSATGDPGFVPFSFQETWTFAPTLVSTPGTLGPPFQPLTSQTRTAISTLADQAATVSASPVTGALQTLGEIDGLTPAASRVSFKNRTTFDYLDVQKTTNTEAEFFQSYGSSTLVSDGGAPGFGQEDLADDIYETRSYRRGFSAQLGDFSPGAMTVDTFVAFLLAQGPLAWSETALHSLGGVYEFSPPPSLYEERNYFGTATLVAPDATVPEPGSWALMILGFGAVGAAMRRRRELAWA